MDQETAEKQEARRPDGLLAEGKRSLAAGDAASAVENFQDACSLLVDQFGQLSKELAEPYYLYGKALLECARMENTVLGSAMLVPEESGSSSDEEDEEEEEGENGAKKDTEVDSQQQADVPQSTTDDAETEPSGVCEGEGKEEKKGDEKEESKVEGKEIEAEKEGKGEEGEKEGQGEGGEKEGQGEGGEKEGQGEGGEIEKEGEGESEGVNGDTEAGPSGKGEGGKGNEDGEEEETDLKLAWEVLELARIICQKEDTDEYKLKLSDVYLALGEVALESDQIDQAVGDMNSGLQLKELLLDPCDRRLAEAHFNLGLAYSLQKDHQRCIQEYRRAWDTISQRREKLMREVEDKEGSERKEIMEEISDLDALLPDLDAKMTDAQENTKCEEETTTTLGFGGTADVEPEAVTASKVPISDISHLMRKRPADSSSDHGNQPKRIRTEQLPPAHSSSAANGTNDSETMSEQ